MHQKNPSEGDSGENISTTDIDSDLHKSNVIFTDEYADALEHPWKLNAEADPIVAKYQSECQQLIKEEKWFEAEALSAQILQQNPDVRGTKTFRRVMDRMDAYRELMNTKLVTDLDGWELIWQTNTPGDEARFWLQLAQSEEGTSFTVQLQTILDADVATSVLPIQETNTWPLYNKQLVGDPRIEGEGAMERRVQFLEEYVFGWIKLEHVLQMSRFIDDKLGVLTEVDDFIPEGDPRFPLERINETAHLMQGRNRTCYLPTEFQGRDQTLLIMTVLGDIPSWVPHRLIRSVLKKIVPSMRADFVKNVQMAKGLLDDAKFNALLDKGSADFYERLKRAHQVGRDELVEINGGARVCPAQFPPNVLMRPSATIYEVDI